MSRRRQALEKRLGDLVLRDVKAKCAGLLLDLAGEFGRACEGGGTLIDIVRTHLAGLLKRLAHPVESPRVVSASASTSARVPGASPKFAARNS